MQNDQNATTYCRQCRHVTWKMSHIQAIVTTICPILRQVELHVTK